MESDDRFHGYVLLKYNMENLSMMQGGCQCRRIDYRMQILAVVYTS